MATKNLVPRADDEGKIGLRDSLNPRRWTEINAVTGSLNYLRTDELKNLTNIDLLKAGDNITITRTQDNEAEGWRYKISSTASGGGSSHDADKIVEGDSSVEVIDSGSNGKIEFKIDNVPQWRINNSKALVPLTNANDIGSNSEVVRSLYLKGTDSSGESFGVNFSDVSGNWKSNLSLTSTNRLRIASRKDGSNLVFDSVPVFKEPVKVATTENLNYTYDVSSGKLTEVGTTGTLNIDGITSFSLENRILVKNQTNSVDNGIYRIVHLTANSSVVLQRDTDAQIGEDFSNTIVFALEGTKNSGVCFTSKPDGTTANTIGTHNLNWATSSSTGISALSEDSAPILGGHLDVVQWGIKTGAASTIRFYPKGMTEAGVTFDQGSIELKTTVPSGGATLRLHSGLKSGSSFYIDIKTPDYDDFVDGSNITLKLPVHTGVNNDTIATQEWVGSSYALTTALDSYLTSADLNGYATEAYVTNNTSSFITNSVMNLTNYYTKTETDTEIDNKISGLDEILESVKVATTTNLNYTYSSSPGRLTENGTTGTLAIDNISSFSVNDRILVKEQDNPINNGIYKIITLTQNSAVVLERVDFAHGATMNTKFVYVESGSDNGKIGYISSGSGTVGTNTLKFRKFSSSSSLSVSSSDSALSLVNNVLKVMPDDSSLEINSSNKLIVKNTGITNAMLAGSIGDNKLSTIASANKVSLTAININGGTGLGSDTLKSTGFVIADIDGNGVNRKITISELKSAITSTNDVSTWNLGPGNAGDVYLDNEAKVLKISPAKVLTSHIQDGNITSTKLANTLISSFNAITHSDILGTESSLLVEKGSSLKKITASDLLKGALNIDDFNTYADDSVTLDKVNDKVLIYDNDAQKHRKVSAKDLVESVTSSSSSAGVLDHVLIDLINQMPVNNAIQNPVNINKRYILSSNKAYTIIHPGEQYNNLYFDLPQTATEGDSIIISFESKYHPNQGNSLNLGTNKTLSQNYISKFEYDVFGQFNLYNSTGSLLLASYSISDINRTGLTLRYDGSTWRYPTSVSEKELHHYPHTTMYMYADSNSDSDQFAPAALWGKTVMFTAQQDLPREIWIPDNIKSYHRKSPLRIISWGKNQIFTIRCKNTSSNDVAKILNPRTGKSLTSPELVKEITINAGPGIIEIIGSQLTDGTNNFIQGSDGKHDFNCWVVSYPAAALTVQDILDVIDGSPASGDPSTNNKLMVSTTDSPTKFSLAQLESEMIADNAITSGKIADGAVGVNDIASDAVSTIKIQNNAINATKLASNAVATAKIADNAVITSKIADSAVTKSKMEDVSPYKILGNVPADPNATNTNASPVETSVNTDLTVDAASNDHSSLATTKAIKAYVVSKTQNVTPTATSSSQYKYITFLDNSPPGQIASITMDDFSGDTAHIVVKNARWRRNLNVNKVNPDSDSWANKNPRLTQNKSDLGMHANHPTYIPSGYQTLMGIEFPRVSPVVGSVTALPGQKIVFYYISTIDTTALHSSLTGDYTHVPGNIDLYVNRNDKVFLDETIKDPDHYHGNFYNSAWTGADSGYDAKYEIDLTDSSIYDSTKSEQENMITILNSIKSISSLDKYTYGGNTTGDGHAYQALLTKAIPKGFRDFNSTKTDNIKEAVWIKWMDNAMPGANGTHEIALQTGGIKKYAQSWGMGLHYGKWPTSVYNSVPHRVPSKSQQSTHCIRCVYELIHQRNGAGLVWTAAGASHRGEIIPIPSGIS